MIEKFNFYDVYGYFIPGVALLALIWLPFGVVSGSWPATEWTAAVVAVIAAYIAGHVLQSFVSATFTRKDRDSTGGLRYPSSFILDPEDSNLSPELKKELAVQVALLFRIELATDMPGSQQIDARRQDAFLLCRSLLVARKLSSYAEQYKGLYAMMGGLTLAFWLGSVYLAGWSLALLRCFGIARKSAMPYFTDALLALGLLGLAAVLWKSLLRLRGKRRESPDLPSFLALAMVFLSLGYYLGLCRETDCRTALLLLIIAVAALIVGARGFYAYKSFALEFAKAVWRDFVAFRLAPVAKTE